MNREEANNIINTKSVSSPEYKEAQRFFNYEARKITDEAALNLNSYLKTTRL